MGPKLRPRVMAYFDICWSKYKTLFMLMLKKNTLPVRTHRL